MKRPITSTVFSIASLLQYSKGRFVSPIQITSISIASTLGSKDGDHLLRWKILPLTNHGRFSKMLQVFSVGEFMREPPIRHWVELDSSLKASPLVLASSNNLSEKTLLPKILPRRQYFWRCSLFVGIVQIWGWKHGGFILNHYLNAFNVGYEWRFILARSGVWVEDDIDSPGRGGSECIGAIGHCSSVLGDLRVIVRWITSQTN